MLEKVFRDGIGSVECRQEVYDDYNAEVEAMHTKLVWSHPGMSTYYRHSRGRIVVDSPWRNVDFFRFFRDPDLVGRTADPSPARRRKSDPSSILYDQRRAGVGYREPA